MSSSLTRSALGRVLQQSSRRAASVRAFTARCRCAQHVHRLGGENPLGIGSQESRRREGRRPRVRRGTEHGANLRVDEHGTHLRWRSAKPPSSNGKHLPDGSRIGTEDGVSSKSWGSGRAAEPAGPVPSTNACFNRRGVPRQAKEPQLREPPVAAPYVRGCGRGAEEAIFRGCPIPRSLRASAKDWAFLHIRPTCSPDPIPYNPPR